MEDRTSLIKKNNIFFRQLLFIMLLLTIGIVLIKELNFFVGAFLGAVTIYIVLRKPLFKLTEENNWPHWVASLFLVTATTIVLLGIGFFVFEMVANQIPNIDTSKLTEGVKGLVNEVNEYTGMNIAPAKFLQGEQGQGFISKLLSGILNSAYSFAINIFLMLVILYFMFAGGRKMECKLLTYSPFEGESLEILNCELYNVVFSNAVGIPIILIAQGVTAGIIYWLMGFSNVMFWAFLTAICGLIPMIGTSLVTVPMGIYLIADGNTLKGILLIGLGLLVIANADNLTRIVLMKKVANTHPLIVIFGVIFGIPFFGFWGIIFGPLLISVFLLLIRIYFVEYKLVRRSEL